MKINKIKFILVFFLLLVGSMETIAQVQQYPKMAASNSIARTINEGTAIIYSQKSATQGCFIPIFTGSPCRSAPPCSLNP